MADRAAEGEAREFAAAFRRFLEWVHSPAATGEGANEVVALVQEVLGPDGVAAVGGDPRAGRVRARQPADRAGRLVGRAGRVGGGARHRHAAALRRRSLQQLVTGEVLPPLRLSRARPWSTCRTGRTRRWRACASPLLLVEDERGRYVVLVQGPGEHQQPSDRRSRRAAGRRRAGGARRARRAAQPAERLPRSAARRRRSPRWAGSVLTFAEPPGLGRDDVVLPEAGAGPGRTARAGRRRRTGTRCWPRPASQARAAALRPAGHRQDPHHPLPARPDDRLHPAGPDRPVAARGRPGRRARPRPAAGGRRAGGRRPGRRGPLYGPASSPVLFDLLDAMDGGARTPTCCSC